MLVMLMLVLALAPMLALLLVLLLLLMLVLPRHMRQAPVNAAAGARSLVVLVQVNELLRQHLRGEHCWKVVSCNF